MSFDSNKMVRVIPIQPARNKLILLLLSDMSDDKGTAYPSIRTLARYSGLAKSSVQRAINELCEQGYFLVTRRSRGKQRSVNIYRLRLEYIEGLAAEANQSAAESRCQDDTTCTDSAPTPVPPIGTGVPEMTPNAYRLSVRKHQ